MQKAISENSGSQCGFCTPGIVIALIAMILDRITSGLAKNSVTYKPREKSFLKRKNES